MRIVLHSPHDLEPITAVEVPIDVLKELQTKKVASFGVHGSEPILILAREFKLDDNRTYWLYIVNNEESALMIKPVLLPGQFNAREVI